MLVCYHAIDARVLVRKRRTTHPRSVVFNHCTARCFVRRPSSNLPSPPFVPRRLRSLSSPIMVCCSLVSGTASRAGRRVLRRRVQGRLWSQPTHELASPSRRMGVIRAIDEWHRSVVARACSRRGRRGFQPLPRLDTTMVVEIEVSAATGA
jgi:hypothetical protein